MKTRLFILLIITAALQFSCKRAETPTACGPVPTENQLAWQQMEFYSFIHFSINTYTNQEWGDGSNSPELFNPAELDCRQWARICRDAGMKGIILTAKHHDGFCLWPSKYTEYSVKNSPWRGGKGDLVRELSDACREYGLKMGIYLSPWDRNHPEYGRPEYITYFRNQLTELLTNYGDIFEIWFDGANGGTGYYGGEWGERKIDRKTYYDWAGTFALVRELQPGIVVWNDGGDRGDLRWCGNESGSIGETNWSLLNATGDVPDDMLRHGLEMGNSWVPGEVNVSVRPGWFYHAYEDGRVKTLSQMLDIYYASVGRNASLLLNLPVDPRGLVHGNDEKAVLEFGAAVKETFDNDLARGRRVEVSNFRGGDRRFGGSKAVDGDPETYWATDDGVTSASLTLALQGTTVFNRFLMQEYIRLGQRVKAFTLEAFVDDEWVPLADGTTIGYKRILCFSTVEASKVRLTITAAKACPLISAVGIYNAPQILTLPAIYRDRMGEIHIAAADSGSEIYFTLDGSIPTTDSRLYTAPVDAGDGKIHIKARAYDPLAKRYSEIAEERFDVSRKSWKILGIEAEEAWNVIDGDVNTSWVNTKGGEMPVDLVVDMGRTENLCGFRYLPSQSHGWKKDVMITAYRFWVSEDNKKWVMTDEGEFPNIENNPLWQTKYFEPVDARYVKLSALENTYGDVSAGYAEFDIITYDGR